MLIKNGCIVLEDRILKGDLRIKDGVIAELGVDLCSDSDTVLDADGLYVCPGFVDIHTHGGYGSDFMDATDEAFDNVLKFHLDNGTTSVVATSVTASISSTERFKRWISSINKTSPSLRLVKIAAKSPERSIAGPLVSFIATSISFAIICASVVFPSPGGP